MSPCPGITPKSQLSKNAETKRRTKTARQKQLAHAATPIRANSNELLSKSIQGINRVRDTKIAGAPLPPYYFILAAAHFKSVIYENASRDYLAGL
jgi:hypothetical protein